MEEKYILNWFFTKYRFDLASNLLDAPPDYSNVKIDNIAEDDFWLDFYDKLKSNICNYILCRFGIDYLIKHTCKYIVSNEKYFRLKLQHSFLGESYILRKKQANLYIDRLKKLQYRDPY
jgi:hypothetical protein